MSESPRLINANSISKINRGWLTEHQNWPFHIKNSKFILEFLLVGLCQSVKNLNGLYNLHSPFSFACNFQVESTPAFFKRKICLSLSTKTTELLNPQNERTVKEHSILHLRASPSPLKTFPQLNKLENHDDAELWSAVQHLPEMRKYDLIWQVEWSRVLSWIWSASYRASFVGKCPPCPILLPVTALKKRQFLPKAFFSPSGKKSMWNFIGQHLEKGSAFYSRFLRAFPSLLTQQNYLYLSEECDFEGKLETLGKLFHLSKSHAS